jgi:hypothetical protein
MRSKSSWPQKDRRTMAHSNHGMSEKGKSRTGRIDKEGIRCRGGADLQGEISEGEKHIPF